MQGQQVFVEHLGTWLPAVVLWEYIDTGRPRALIRFETAAGLVFLQLRWTDELRAAQFRSSHPALQAFSAGSASLLEVVPAG